MLTRAINLEYSPAVAASVLSLQFMYCSRRSQLVTPLLSTLVLIRILLGRVGVDGNLKPILLKLIELICCPSHSDLCYSQKSA